jgi:hypothetical protein
VCRIDVVDLGFHVFGARRVREQSTDSGRRQHGREKHPYQQERSINSDSNEYERGKRQYQQKQSINSGSR